MRVWRLSDVCLSRTSGLSQEQRGLGRLKLAQRLATSHVTRTPLSRSKGQLAGGGGILWRPPAQPVYIQMRLFGVGCSFAWTVAMNASGADNYCNGAETKVSVPLRYHQPTFHDNKLSSSTTKQHSKLQQLPLTTNVDMSCHLAEVKRSFVPFKRRRQTSSSMKNLQIKPRHMQALHYVFFSFSFCQLSFCSSTS